MFLRFRGSCGGCVAPLPISTVGKTCILGSISRAWKLGKTILEAKKTKSSISTAILSCEDGKLLCKAKIIDVSRRTVGGFSRGQMSLEGLDEYSSEKYLVEFQNENLVVKDLRSTKTLVSVPDLICLIETDSGLPIATEELKYGLKVLVLVLKPNHLLVTDQALAVVGPKAFGYSEIDYAPYI